ncbi:MAG TPA: zinc carboxypeptidase, partial [Balneolaceae bacterium]|nr:zinc carboxypeptidase [Balneolaceae bacterium]
TVYELPTGLTPTGMDLGSNNFENLQDPKVAIIGGSGTSSYEVGETWHLMDQRYHMPLTILESDELARAELDRYNVIVSSGYSMSDAAAENLKTWVSEGGTLIVYRNALHWAKSQGFANIEYAGADEDETENADIETDVRPYINQGPDSGAEYIGGTIFNAKLDLT